MPTNDPNDRAPLKKGEADKLHGRSDDRPGYETTDVNVGGVIVFLAGLSGFLAVFFLLCFGLGILINKGIERHDGPVNKWNQLSSFAGAEASGGKRQDLASNPEMQQKAFQQMTASFPSPRLDIDDGNQATADLHAREDLLLGHYSTVSGQSSIRIPIEQAMALIAKRGLPQSPGAAPTQQLVGDSQPEVQVPLTTGFARTSYELDVMEARAQKMSYGKATSNEHAELQPAK